MWFCGMLRPGEKGGGSKKMMTNSNKLFQWRDPYDTAGDGRAVCRRHGGRTPFFRRRAARTTPASSANTAWTQDVWQTCGTPAVLPPLPTVYCKRHTLRFPAGEEAPRPGHLLRHRRGDEPGGPGTPGLWAGGCPCRCGWPATTASSLRRPATTSFWATSPGGGNDTAFSKTGFAFTFFAPALSRTYALVWREGGLPAGPGDHEAPPSWPGRRVPFPSAPSAFPPTPGCCSGSWSGRGSG